MGGNDNLLKGLPGQPALQGDLRITDTDGATALFTIGKAGGMVSWGGIESSLTAHAGGTQAAALALSTTKPVHVVTTVGTAADSVMLPASAGAGQMHLVSNQGANSMQLFGAGTDTINGVATATGVAVAAGKTALCVDFAAGKWFAIIA